MHQMLLYVGDPEAAIARIPEADRIAGTDVFHFTERTFRIADARRLKEMAFQTPLTRNERVFLIVATTITTEAQNALLKLFEEPPATARFHILVPREEVLIPTLRSRLSHVSVSGARTDTDVARAFLALQVAKRLTEITAHIKAKDTQWVEAVITGAEELFSKQKDHRALAAIALVRKYIDAPRASKKMLLEYLALTLPVQN